MRYPDGGGLSAVGPARRAKARLQAAQMFEQGIRPVQVAQQLRAVLGDRRPPHSPMSLETSSSRRQRPVPSAAKNARPREDGWSAAS